MDAPQARRFFRLIAAGDHGVALRHMQADVIIGATGVKTFSIYEIGLNDPSAVFIDGQHGIKLRQLEGAPSLALRMQREIAAAQAALGDVGRVGKRDLAAVAARKGRLQRHVDDGGVRRVHAHLQHFAPAGRGEDAALQGQLFIGARSGLGDDAGHEIPKTEFLPCVGAVVYDRDARLHGQRSTLRVQRHIHRVRKAVLLRVSRKRGEQRGKKQQRGKGADGAGIYGLHRFHLPFHVSVYRTHAAV